MTFQTNNYRHVKEVTAPPKKIYGVITKEPNQAFPGTDITVMLYGDRPPRNKKPREYHCFSSKEQMEIFCTINSITPKPI